MASSLVDGEWSLVDKELWEKTYRSEDNLLYVEDRYKNYSLHNQTEFSDYEEDRYAVKLRETGLRNSRGGEKPFGDKLVLETDDWEEVASFLDSLTSSNQ